MKSANVRMSESSQERGVGGWDDKERTPDCEEMGQEEWIKVEKKKEGFWVQAMC